MVTVTQEEKIEIVKGISEGKTLSEISDDLKVNTKTLEKRLERLRVDYQAKTSCHLVAIFIRKKIIK